MSKNDYKGPRKTIVDQVRYAAKKLKKHYVFRTEGLEDIEQDLKLFVFPKLSFYEDIKNNLSTFEGTY